MYKLLELNFLLDKDFHIPVLNIGMKGELLLFSDGFSLYKLYRKTNNSFFIKGHIHKQFLLIISSVVCPRLTFPVILTETAVLMLIMYASSTMVT